MESSSSIYGGTGRGTRTGSGTGMGTTMPVLGMDMDIARGLVDGPGKGVWCTGGGLMGGGILMYVGVLWTGLACIFGSY